MAPENVNREPSDSPPPVVRQQERSELSTRRLLDAAAELIAEVGLNNTTLAMIGERAGYSHGLVTLRFGSKEGLLISLVDRMTSGWFETFVDPALAEMTGYEALCYHVRVVRESWARSHRRMRALYTLMFESAIQPIPALRERMQRLHLEALASSAQLIRRGVEDGTIRFPVDPEVLARHHIERLRGIAYLAILLPDDYDVEAALSDMEASYRLIKTQE